MAPREERPGFSVLICPDSELLKERMAALQAKYLDDPAKWEKTAVWGDEEPDARFWESLGQGGLFGNSRLLIARQAHLWKAEAWKAMSSALSSRRDNLWPFICLEVGWEKGKFKIPAHIAKLKFLEFARKRGWVWEQKGLEGAELEKFVLREAKKAGVILEGEALRLFLDNVIPDAGAVRSEIGKLALLHRGEKVSPDMLAMDSGNMEKDAFGALRKMENGDFKGVIEDIQGGNQSGRLFFLISVAARELRLLWQLEDGGNPWMPRDEAPLKRKIARSLGKKGLARGFALVARAEWLVKSGERSPEQTFETFCMELARLFAGAQ